MNIGKAFTYIFDDEEWFKKLALGGLITIIPILNFATLGYLVEVIKNVRNNDERPLPDWSEGLGQFFMSGVMVLVGLLVYSLPAIIVACIFGIFFAVLGSAMENSNGDTAGMVFGLARICFFGVIFILAFLPYILTPAGMVRYAETGQLNAMFKFGDLTEFIKKNTSGYIIVLLLGLVVLVFLAPLGLIACMVGVFLTQWWAYLVFGHLTGQLWRNNELLV